MHADATSTKLTSHLLVEQLLTEGTNMFFVAPRSLRSPMAKKKTKESLAKKS